MNKIMGTGKFVVAVAIPEDPRWFSSGAGKIFVGTLQNFDPVRLPGGYSFQDMKILYDPLHKFGGVWSLRGRILNIGQGCPFSFSSGVHKVPHFAVAVVHLQGPHEEISPYDTSDYGPAHWHEWCEILASDLALSALGLLGAKTPLRRDSVYGPRLGPSIDELLRTPYDDLPEWKKKLWTIRRHLKSFQQQPWITIKMTCRAGYNHLQRRRWGNLSDLSLPPFYLGGEAYGIHGGQYGTRELWVHDFSTLEQSLCQIEEAVRLEAEEDGALSSTA